MLRYRENCRSASQVPRAPSNFSIASKTRRTHANPEPIVSYQCHYSIKFKFLQINPMKAYTRIYAIIPVRLPHKICTLELNLHQQFRVFCGQVFTSRTQLQNRS